MNFARNVLQKRKRDIDNDETTYAPTTATALPSAQATQYPADFAPRLIALFERIQRRGQEALLPISWQLDFLNLPHILFMHHLSDQQFAPIRSMSLKPSHEFRGKLAIDRLLRMGRDVRERLQVCRQDSSSKRRNQAIVENCISDGIKHFLRWAADDAGITPESLWLYVRISMLRKSQRCKELNDSHDQLSLVMTDKLRYLAKSHRDSAVKTHKRSRLSITRMFREDADETIAFERTMSTTVYGFAIFEARVAIVALNVRDPAAPIRTILACDFADATQDLWSVLAIMLVICAAREERLDNRSVKSLLPQESLTTTFARLKVEKSSDVDA